MKIKKAFAKKDAEKKQKVRLIKNSNSKTKDLLTPGQIHGWSWGCCCDTFDPNSLNSDDD